MKWLKRCWRWEAGVAIEYRPGHSRLHGLDARTKIALFVGCTVTVLLFEDPLILGALFALLYVVGARSIDRPTLNRNLRPLVTIFSVFFVFNILFYRPANAMFLFYVVPALKWAPITVEGLVRSAAVFFRFFVVVLSLHLVLYTTAPSELVLGMTRQAAHRKWATVLVGVLSLAPIFYGTVWLIGGGWLLTLNLSAALNIGAAVGLALAFAALADYGLARGLPPEMGLALSIGFATVGILTQQTQKILDAQKARGYEIEYRNPLKRFRALAISLLPIFWATLERAQHIAIAILARAFDYNIQARTYRRALAFRRDDYAVLALIAAALLGGMAVSYYRFGNVTEQFIRALL
jgi:energy-coupling factor transporter transmembrane protein EcfT